MGSRTAILGHFIAIHCRPVFGVLNICYGSATSRWKSVGQKEDAAHFVPLFYRVAADS